MKTTPTEDRLLKELRAAKTAIQKMKAECNQFDEGYEIGAAALKRLNAVLKDYRRPVAMPAMSRGEGRCSG